MLSTLGLLVCLALSAWIAEEATAETAEVSAQAHPAEMQLEILSKPFHVDRIFKSMRGPLTTRRVRFSDASGPELVWLTGYVVEVLGADGETPESMEFECHTNLNWPKRARRPNWSHRLRSRIFTLTQGQTDIRLPPGFGLPMRSDEFLVFNTQALNLNEPVIDRTVFHRAQLRYVRDRDLTDPMKPLASTMAQVVVTLESEPRVWNVEKPDDRLEGASCAVGEYAGARKRIATDEQGKHFAAFWVVPPGRQEFHTLVTDMLAIPFDTTVHAIGTHVHPYSVSLELRDLTTEETIYKSYQKRFDDRLGLERVDFFSSEEGIPIYKDHQYEMVSVYDNTSDQDSDAMASMFLYFLDKKFEHPRDSL